MRFQTGKAQKPGYVPFATMRNRAFFDKDYSTNYGLLKRIISADDVVSEVFL